MIKGSLLMNLPIIKRFGPLAENFLSTNMGQSKIDVFFWGGGFGGEKF